MIDMTEVRMEQMDLHDGDIVVVRFTSHDPDVARHWASQLRRYLDRHGHPDVLFVAVNDDVSIDRLSVADMAELGWQPANKAP